MAPAPNPSRPRPRRVLVAEDLPDHRAWLVSLLRQQGFEVAEAHDGKELVDMLLMVPAGHFDLVVCDQMMPGLRGTECLSRASARAGWIIVTASGDPQVETAALHFGAVGVLRKPFSAAELRRLVERASDSRASGTRPILMRTPRDDDA